MAPTWGLLACYCWRGCPRGGAADRWPLRAAGPVYTCTSSSKVHLFEVRRRHEDAALSPVFGLGERYKTSSTCEIVLN